MASIAGLQTGLAIHIVLVGVGLGTLFSRSVIAFEVLKWAGAAYLIWLGIQQWRAAGAIDLKSLASTQSRRHLFQRAVFVNLTNPKSIVFLAALFPQFIMPQQPQLMHEIQRALAGPFTGTFVSRFIQNHINQVVTVFIFFSEDVFGDVDQVAAQFTVIPLGKGLRQFFVGKIQATFKQRIGFHTRIDETIAQVTGSAHVGNLYVNRNMVGAVVGVQPFGGEGLSGTGPKAGGPLYLYRLLANRPESALAVTLARIFMGEMQRHCAVALHQ